jgi:hypothetical protein
VNATRARIWFGLTAAVVAFGIIVQEFVTANSVAGHFQTPLTRALNVFAFFTVQSNLIVGATCLLLAVNPNRSSTVFRVFRLTGVVAITITGVVYHAVLRQLFDLESWALVADNALHTVVPALAVLGWLIYGPRGQTSRRIARLSVIFPVCWLLFTLIRGEIVGFYPYPFVDVATLGYARVLINCVWISALYLGLAVGATALDGRLDRGETTTNLDPSPLP